jgi:hypothetical protein
MAWKLRQLFQPRNFLAAPRKERRGARSGGPPQRSMGQGIAGQGVRVQRHCHITELRDRQDARGFHTRASIYLLS